MQAASFYSHLVTNSTEAVETTQDVIIGNPIEHCACTCTQTNNAIKVKLKVIGYRKYACKQNIKALLKPIKRLVKTVNPSAIRLGNTWERLKLFH